MRDFYIFSLVLGVLAFMRFLVAVEFIRVWLARAELTWGISARDRNLQLHLKHYVLSAHFRISSTCRN